MTLQTPERIDQDVRTLRDHFIPIGRSDLIAILMQQSQTRCHSTAEELKQLATALDQRFAMLFRRELHELVENYSLFDPDCILVDVQREGEAVAAERRVEFYAGIENALQRANFRKLSPDEINSAMSAAKALGIRLTVDFTAFAHLSVWVRGEHTDRWIVRRWYRLYRAESIEVPVHRRLVLVYQDAETTDRADSDPGSIFLKIFKNIPLSDIDTLLPTCKIKLTWFDQGKILLPTVSGLGLTLLKVAKTGFIALMFSGVYGIIALVMLIVASIGYSLRSFFGYLHTKDKYQLNLTRHLYYQNLGNNVGVLFRLAHEAEEQEFRETLIAYHVLRELDAPEGSTRNEIDLRAEAWLLETLKVPVDFEIEDALKKLEHFGMAERVDEQRWRARPILAAIAALHSQAAMP